ncbi:bZIP transcription factor [Ceratobasidium sp. AG-Ba]|nr:bZIP transcription factor [Ceratobasidium sp. AG-Ba]
MSRTTKPAGFEERRAKIVAKRRRGVETEMTKEDILNAAVEDKRRAEYGRGSTKPTAQAGAPAEPRKGARRGQAWDGSVERASNFGGKGAERVQGAVWVVNCVSSISVFDLCLGIAACVRNVPDLGLWMRISTFPLTCVGLFDVNILIVVI